MTAGAQNIAKQILMITRANREHSTVAGQLSQFVTGLESNGGEAKRPAPKTAAAQTNGKRSPSRKTRRPRS